MRYDLIIDGGTTNLRVTLADGDGKVLGVRRSAAGAAAAAAVGNNGALKHAVRDGIGQLLEEHGLGTGDVSRCIAYGMITSASGLMEIPHLCAPADAESLRRGMQSAYFEEIAPFPIGFIPGVKNFGGAVTADNLARMDMMRGEETEAVGFYELVRPGEACVLILPGSHNKLISMDAQGRILGCMTTLSGELLAALTQHTILTEAVGGRFVDIENYDRAMMLAGAEACAAGIGRAAFSTRILRTLGGVPQEKAASFLLGVALRSDVEALDAFGAADGARLYIAGKEPLQTAMADLLGAYGRTAHVVDAAIVRRIGVTGAQKIADCPAM